jgi:sugar/nucleoside kinase (ribokinase family)
MPATEIVGTAGAGDALAAGILLGLHEDWPLPRCLELGVCAAAASLRDGTCSQAIESVEACLALGHRHGFRTS